MKRLKEKFYYFAASIFKDFPPERKTKYHAAKKTMLAKGFTLTEVLVVVLVIGVISAIAYPTYTKAINKSRAVEAINLLEMIRNKQISNFARRGEYVEDFSQIGQLTGDIAKEEIGSNKSKMMIGKYELSINAEASCMTASYIPSAGKDPVFTFSSSYEESGLGCEGDICTSFGNIIGPPESVCNCGDKDCGVGFDKNPISCACTCSLECNQNNACFNMQQNKPVSQSCGYNNSGTQTRTCTKSCDGGTCSAWSSCTGQTCNSATKPAETQNCSSGCGTQTRTVTCENGTWKAGEWRNTCGQKTQNKPTSQSCGHNNSGTQTRTCVASCDGGSCQNWGACTGQTCDENVKPSASEACANCGTKTRTVNCTNGVWTPGAWSGCSGTKTEFAPCDSGYEGNKSRVCSNDVWGAWSTSACRSTVKECPASSKPAVTQACGNCGTQTRTVTCDTSTGNWNTGSWSSCSGQGVCSPGATLSCAGGGGSQTCSSSCTWGSCQCNSGNFLDERSGRCRKANCSWRSVGGGTCSGDTCRGYRQCSRLSTCTTYKHNSYYQETCQGSRNSNATHMPQIYGIYQCDC